MQQSDVILRLLLIFIGTGFVTIRLLLLLLLLLRMLRMTPVRWAMATMAAASLFHEDVALVFGRIQRFSRSLSGVREGGGEGCKGESKESECVFHLE